VLCFDDADETKFTVMTVPEYNDTTTHTHTHTQRPRPFAAALFVGSWHKTQKVGLLLPPPLPPAGAVMPALAADGVLLLASWWCISDAAAALSYILDPPLKVERRAF
jgi:hypothetical protein